MTWIMDRIIMVMLSADNIFALAIRKQNVPIKFIKLEEARFEFFNEHRSGFSELPADCT